jgi:hypothetical protein
MKKQPLFAAMHRFTRDGRLVKSWGTPGKGEGQFHLPHSIASTTTASFMWQIDRTSASRSSPDGDFLGQWTGLGAPMTSPEAGTTFLHRRAGRRRQTSLCLRGRWTRKSAGSHGEPPCPARGRRSRGDIYAGLTQERVHKFARVG